MKTLEELGLFGNLPWGACISQHGHYCYVTDNANLGDGDSRKHILASEIWRSNAVLFAAAPEMYQALEECERKLDAIDPYCNMLGRVRDALAKAGGAE